MCAPRTDTMRSFFAQQGHLGVLNLVEYFRQAHVIVEYWVSDTPRTAALWFSPNLIKALGPDIGLPSSKLALHRF